MAMADLPIRILVVAEEALARAGLAAVLEGRPGVQIVGQCSPFGELDAMLTATRPEVLLWDLGWNPEVQLEILTGRSADLPPAAVLLPGAEHYTEARRAGARAVLSREADRELLALAAHSAQRGLILIDPALEDLQPEAHAIESRPAGGDLTERELEVLRLVAEGLPNKAIASRLGISDHTVKFHLNSVLRKLGAQSRTDAVVRATRLGLLYL
jgi:DNA-binding NarL/FixJ family response regulator